MKPHPNTAFNADMQNLEILILKMGGRVAAAIERATQAFVSRDAELAQRVVLEDQHVDALESDINSAVVRMLALRQPAASDLYEVVSVMKVAGDLERLGDYAKNLARRVPVLVQSDRIEGATAAIRRLSMLVQSMLRDVLDAYTNTDLALAQTVLDRDVEVDQMTNTLFRDFLTHMMEDPRNITVCMHLLFIAKNFERMGDHVTEIGEQVIFVETGEQPVPRAKGESTSQITGPLGVDGTG
jgi:phosphate transport system protein